jgi:hypothetical protein
MSRRRNNNKARYFKPKAADLAGGSYVFNPGSGDVHLDLGPLAGDLSVTIGGQFAQPGDRLTVTCYGGGGVDKFFTINGAVGGGPNIQLGAFDFFGVDFVVGVAGDGVTPNYICLTPEILFNNLP